MKHELEAEQRFLAVQACKNMVLSVLMQQTPPTPSTQQVLNATVL